MTLVAPLNWGLGHATRCVPIINKLVSQGQQVIIAADGAALAFLSQEFPNLPTIRLSGYKMRYFGGRLLPLALFLQMPLFAFSILIEHWRLKAIVSRFGIQRVVSDNRYGLWNKNTENIIVTHQLYIQLPYYLKFLQKPLHSLTQRLLSRFNQIWVPDYADESVSLSGALSHGGRLDSEVRYIGPQSRFNLDAGSDATCPIPDLLLMLSGPGRQKKRFAKQVTGNPEHKGNFIMIVGAEPEADYQIRTGNVLKINHLPTPELNRLLLLSPQIIARSGYSTIMDLHVLKRTATLVATPGQWEQIYLCNRIKSQGAERG